VNLSSDEKGSFVVWCMRKRLKKEATRRKSWSHPSTNELSQQCCCSQGTTAMAMKDLDHFTGL
jgi:hypothetical protein